MTTTNRPAAMPPLSKSAAVHAERIARAQQQRPEPPDPDGRTTTAERYAERILPGYRADEDLRHGARRRELEARGIITPEPEEYDEDGVEAEEPYDEDEEEREPTTAEVYAARVRGGVSAEGASARVARRSSSPGGGYVVA